MALALPTNATRRLALGARQAPSSDPDWGASVVDVLPNDLDVNTCGGSVPVAVGGRGTVTGSFERPRTLLFALSLNWRF